MRRRIFTLASVMSLLLCLAAVTVSTIAPPMWSVSLIGGKAGTVFISAEGVSYWRAVEGIWRQRNWKGFSVGMTYGYGPVLYPRPSNLIITVPHWFLTILFALLPATWLPVRMLRSKDVANLCSTCSYNLTGNTSGTCPECGSPITIPT